MRWIRVESIFIELGDLAFGIFGVEVSKNVLLKMISEPAENTDRVFVLTVLKLQEIVTVDRVENRRKDLLHVLGTAFINARCCDRDKHSSSLSAVDSKPKRDDGLHPERDGGLRVTPARNGSVRVSRTPGTDALPFTDSIVATTGETMPIVKVAGTGNELSEETWGKTAIARSAELIDAIQALQYPVQLRLGWMIAPSI